MLAGVLPAAARGDHGPHHDEADAEREVGALEVAARPSIAQVGNPVHVRAEYGTDSGDSGDDAGDTADDAGDSGDTSADDESTDDSADTTDGDQVDASAKDRHGDGTADDSADDETDDGDSADTQCDAADDEATEADGGTADDESTETSDADCEDSADPATTSSVTFTVDFGDGSDPVAMTLDGERRHADKAKAHATHAYDAEGDYDVTVTATPDGGDPEVATIVVSVGRGAARLEGDDRVETALRISRDSFDDGSAGAVLLARSDGFADALASATLALAEEAPVLLVPSTDLPADVKTEIQRVLGDTGRVYLLGGESAIAPGVADELTALGYDVVRVAGEDRVATSVAITQFLIDAGATIDEVVLASAASFPDALSGAAYAAERGAPVLLTAPEALSPQVRDLLSSLGTDVAVTVVGGTAGVSDAVVDELTGMGFAVERLAGDDRYDTAVDIAEADAEDPTAVVVATGETFPDALAGGAYAGRLGAPLLLVGDDLPDGVAEYLHEHADTIQVLVVLGGGGAVPQDVMDRIKAALGL
jgi:putative cell wall-binding protein